VLWLLICASVPVVCAWSGWIEQVPWPARAQGAGKEARSGHPDYKVCFLWDITSYSCLFILEDANMHTGLDIPMCLFNFFIGGIWYGCMEVEHWLRMVLPNHFWSTCRSLAFEALNILLQQIGRLIILSCPCALHLNVLHTIAFGWKPWLVLLNNWTHLSLSSTKPFELNWCGGLPDNSHCLA